MVKKHTDNKDRTVHLSLQRSSTIALSFLVFRVTWILVSDTVSAQLFSNVQDVVKFAIIKGFMVINAGGLGNEIKRASTAEYRGYDES